MNLVQVSEFHPTILPRSGWEATGSIHNLLQCLFPRGGFIWLSEGDQGHRSLAVPSLCCIFHLSIYFSEILQHGLVYYFLPHPQHWNGSSMRGLWSFAASSVCTCKFSCSVMSNCLRLHELQPTRLLCPWTSLGENTGLGFHSHLQGIFSTQGSNLHLCLLLWQADSLPLSHLGSPYLEQPHSSGSINTCDSISEWMDLVNRKLSTPRLSQGRGYSKLFVIKGLLLQSWIWWEESKLRIYLQTQPCLWHGRV